MTRANKTITSSLPLELADRVNELAKQQGRTRSELLREALLRYIQDYEWRELLSYGEQKAKERGIEPMDVGPLVEQYRAESNPV